MSFIAQPLASWPPERVIPAAVAASAASAALDLIFIEGFRGETVIGIHDNELNQTQPLVIDVCAGVPRSPACDSDAIGDTIDYGAVRQRLAELMQHHGVKLLEALGERIARLLLDDFGAAWVRVKIVKPAKFSDVQAVGIQLERWAGDSGAGKPPRSAQVLRWIGSGMVPAPE